MEELYHVFSVTLYETDLYSYINLNRQKYFELLFVDFVEGLELIDFNKPLIPYEEFEKLLLEGWKKQMDNLDDHYIRYKIYRSKNSKLTEIDLKTLDIVKEGFVKYCYDFYLTCY